MRWGGVLVLACQPAVVERTNRGQVQIESLDGGLRETQLTFDFGLVQLGRSAQVSVQVANTGLDALTLEPPMLVSSATGGFFVQGAGGVLTPQAIRVFTVTFAPTRVEPEAGRVVFAHDARAPAAIVELAGRGEN